MTVYVLVSYMIGCKYGDTYKIVDVFTDKANALKVKKRKEKFANKRFFSMHKKELVE